MKKRMRQLTTVTSTFIFKYTCTACMCHEEIHAQKWDMYKHIILKIIHSIYMYIYLCHLAWVDQKR